MIGRLAHIGSYGALVLAGVMLAAPALAASPYDDYYKYGGTQTDDSAAVAPADNDSYYTPPSYTDNDAYYTPPGAYNAEGYPTASKHNCNTINDSPSCISD